VRRGSARRRLRRWTATYCAAERELEAAVPRGLRLGRGSALLFEPGEQIVGVPVLGGEQVVEVRQLRVIVTERPGDAVVSGSARERKYRGAAAL